MTRLAAVSKDRHSNRFMRKTSTYFFAANTAVAPLVPAEIPMAVMNLPLAFIANQEKFTLVAMLSLAPDQNLFVGPDGKWINDYIPFVFRSYPFRLVKASQDNQKLVFCVDEASDLIVEDSKDTPFFDENGQLSKPVQDIFDFLRQMEQSRLAIDHAVSALAGFGLIIPWDIPPDKGEEEKPVTGIFKIDKDKLNSIDDESFMKLRKAHALPIAYSQLISMGNLHMLQRLAKMQEQKAPSQEFDPDGFSLVNNSSNI